MLKSKLTQIGYGLIFLIFPIVYEFIVVVWKRQLIISKENFWQRSEQWNFYQVYCEGAIILLVLGGCIAGLLSCWHKQKSKGLVRGAILIWNGFFLITMGLFLLHISTLWGVIFLSPKLYFEYEHVYILAGCYLYMLIDFCFMVYCEKSEQKLNLEKKEL